MGISQSKRRKRGTLATRPKVPGRCAGPNLDAFVLRTENLTPTHVTPSIAALTEGYFREELQVIGARPSLPRDKDVNKRKIQERKELIRLVKRAHTVDRDIRIDHPYVRRADRNSRYYKEVSIHWPEGDSEVFSVRSNFSSSFYLL